MYSWSAEGTRLYRGPSYKKVGVAAGTTHANFQTKNPDGTVDNAHRAIDDQRFVQLIDLCGRR
jgi:hypothetical protein